MDVARLIGSSHKAFKDCLLPNGCLVAAPVHQPYYPPGAKSYMYAWPGRDTSFVLASMLLIGQDYYEPIFQWIWERAEDFQQSNDPKFTGRIYRSYHPNGLVREHQYQPDQGATLLWSLKFKKDFTNKDLTDLEYKVAEKIASTDARTWKENTFKVAIEDLWEERGFESGNGFFSYTLAACTVGMFAAFDLLGNPEYKEVAEKMLSLLLENIWSESHETLVCSFGPEQNVDATPNGSLVGLVWPFNIGFDKKKLQKTLVKIEEGIVSDFGVHRYPGDKYEGADEKAHNHKNEKAGAWPLLTFWIAIAYSELGEKDKANHYFDLVFKKLPKESYQKNQILIPEQIFCCQAVPWVGVNPLLWSHAMALFSTWKLGKL